MRRRVTKSEVMIEMTEYLAELSNVLARLQRRADRLILKLGKLKQQEQQVEEDA